MKQKIKQPIALSTLIGTFLLVFLFASCDLDVPAPSLVEDFQLESPEGVPAIINGIHGDFAMSTVNTGASGGVYLASALLTDEAVHVGSWTGFRGMSDGAVRDDYTEAQAWWSTTSRARWVAEDGYRRIANLYDEGVVEAEVAEPALAEAALMAGFANRVMGDHFDFAVIDGGPREDVTTFYERAINHFDQSLGYGIADFELAAIAGKAQVSMMLGDWDNAIAYAGQIPTDFVYEQVHSNNSSREQNDFGWWFNARNEVSVWGTPFEEWGYSEEHNPDGDPRVVYDQSEASPHGGDDRRPFYRQWKYGSRADNIAIVKGTEMRLIEAEAELLNGNIEGMIDKINDVRGFHGLVDIEYEEVNNEEEAWELLIKESGIELWLEGRRLPNLRRWSENQPGYVTTEVVRTAGPGGAETDPRVNVVESATPFLSLMVSRNEKDSNPNL